MSTCRSNLETQPSVADPSVGDFGHQGLLFSILSIFEEGSFDSTDSDVPCGASRCFMSIQEVVHANFSVPRLTRDEMGGRQPGHDDFAAGT